jgi:AraC-like DNA-binding protein
MRRHRRQRAADSAVLRPARAVPGIDLFSARFAHHVFGRHVHEALAIGAVDAGCGEFWCCHETHRVPSDSLVLIAPGQAHTGGIARHAPDVSGVRLAYRMLYFALEPLETLTGIATDAWHFRSAGPHDANVATLLRRLFDTLATEPDRLAAEACVADTMHVVATRYADMRRDAHASARGEPRAVRRVRELLADDPSTRISLVELARIVGLSPTYLTRVFRRAVGLPPHAYRNQLRVERAKQLLARGERISHVAYRVGFADQAHLTRHFTRSVGVTPARYRQHYARPE